MIDDTTPFFMEKYFQCPTTIVLCPVRGSGDISLVSRFLQVTEKGIAFKRQ